MEVSGSEWLDASATTQFATISLAEHSRLVVTGSLRFIFGEEIIGVIGDASATLVNYGTIATERASSQFRSQATERSASAAPMTNSGFADRRADRRRPDCAARSA